MEDTEYVASHNIKSIELALNCLSKRGISIQQCLDNTEISPNKILNPEVEVTLLQELEFYKNLVSMDFDFPLGLEIGKEHKLENYGVWGLALMSAATLRKSIQLALEYQSLAYTFFKYQFSETATDAIFELVPLADYSASLALLADRDISATIRLLSQVAGQELLLNDVWLMQSADSQKSNYEEHFNCKVTFDAPSFGFSFSTQVLDLQPPNASPTTSDFCAQECARMLKARHKLVPWSERVEQVLSLTKSQASDPKEVAKTLGVSYRSLRRKLQGEGTTYRDIQDRVRYRLAKTLLAKSREPMAEIANTLGFSEPGNFSHAFRRWSGDSPREYRRKIQQHDGVS